MPGIERHARSFFCQDNGGRVGRRDASHLPTEEGEKEKRELYCFTLRLYVPSIKGR